MRLRQGRHPHGLAARAAVIAAVVAVVVVTLAGAFAFPRPVRRRGRVRGRGPACKWVATWAAAPMAAAPARLTAPDDFSSAGFDDQTIRDIVWTSAGGQAARISLSNQFGRGRSRSVRWISASRRAARSSSPAPITASPSPGRCRSPSRPAPPPSVTRWHDRPGTDRPRGQPVHAADRPGLRPITATPSRLITSPRRRLRRQRVGPGFTTTSQHWYFLDEVDVQVGAATGGTIVAFGDSITDGYQSDGRR